MTQIIFLINSSATSSNSFLKCEFIYEFICILEMLDFFFLPFKMHITLSCRRDVRLKVFLDALTRVFVCWDCIKKSHNFFFSNFTFFFSLSLSPFKCYLTACCCRHLKLCFFFREDPPDNLIAWSEREKSCPNLTY